ncbi:MAG: endonuclease I family protein [Eubacteriales bacterium]
MKNYTRLLTLLLVLILMLQMTVSTAFAFVPVNVSADELFASTQPSDYSTQYNSGKRDVVATTLSGTNADAYYTGSYDFDVLSTQSASQILSSLRTLLTSTHTKNSSYDDCKNMAGKTDCEEENGKVLLLYTSVYSTVSAANSGWNREHVWPKSLGGYNTTGPGADLHHIRPSDNQVNSYRGNFKYGNVTGGKNATGANAASGVIGGTYNSSYFEPLDNVKGDVARICLYMYVRYGGMSSYTCSSITNVFQSVDVLLEWCEMDPVDTWELGRNEVVEAYQGNRNVFIDYPEYAWLIFGREVPEDMVTPSGEASNGSNGGNGGNTTPDPEPEPTPDPNPMTEKEILDAAYGLASGASLDGEYTLTGVITALDSYNNPTIVVGDYTSQPMYCYRLVDERFVIGATITVTGTIMNYNGLIEMKNCTLENITLPSDNPEPEPEPEPTPDPEPEPTPDPEPEPTPEEIVDYFKDTVSGLVGLKGEGLYTDICKAVGFYSSMSDEQKVTVSDEYKNLLAIVEKYNAEAESAQNTAHDVSSSIFGYSVIYSDVLCFAVYNLLSKKYV